MKTDVAAGKTWWKCTVCNEVFEGVMPPEICPVCGAGQEAFIEYTPEAVAFRDDRELCVAIIGSGAGGLAAAEALRKRNDKAQIDLYTREELLPYYRPVLTRVLADKVKDTEYFIHPAAFYEKNRIKLHLGATVESLSPRDKSFRLADGKTVKYDKLVLATGASCFVPPIQGANLPEVVALREKTDFDRLNGLLAGGPKKVSIIGGGLLGLETASALNRLGHKVTVLEACPAILPHQLDAAGSPLFTKIIQKSGVETHYGVYVEEIFGEGKVAGLKTHAVQEIPADVVIISAGICPNVELAKAAGLKAGRGVEVNERMQTSDSDIYAVGDCAAVNGQCSGLWDPASVQGDVAGANIAGDDKTYARKLYGATLTAFGTSLFSIGDLGAGDGKYEQIMEYNELSGKYLKIYFKDGKVVGGALLGDVKLTNPLLLSVTLGLDTKSALEMLKR